MNKQEIEKIFNKLAFINEDNDSLEYDNDSGQPIFDNSLLKDREYPESRYELDPKKVKDFIFSFIIPNVLKNVLEDTYTYKGITMSFTTTLNDQKRKAKELYDIDL